MLVTLLGFDGRMGRLRFLIWSLALAAFLTGLTMTLVFSSFDRGQPASTPASLSWVVLVVAPLYAWGSIALCSKRFRDIGWRSLYVIPGWSAIWCVDLLVATTIPSLAVGVGNQTYFGILVSFVMSCVLLFWPGRDIAPTPIDTEAMRRAYLGEAGLAPVNAPKDTVPVLSAPKGFGRKQI